MKFRIKTKLALGLFFLFIIAMLLGGLGAYYLNQLSKDSEVILKDNFESIEYAQNMMKALELQQWDSFEQNLKSQENNVTESGELELTHKLRQQFDQMKFADPDSSYVKAIRTTLFSVIEVNMQAMLRKNRVAQDTSKEALLYILITGSVCFLIMFTFIVNFPGYIANPIRNLTDSIKEIANKNYDERLYFTSADEFGELSDAFNSMAQKLEEYESSNLANILFEKKRIEAIISKMSDPILGLDENKKIIFANAEAINILNISEQDILGKYAPDVAVRNDLLRNLIKDLMGPNLFLPSPEPLKIYVDGKENYFIKDILKVTNVPTGEKSVVVIGFVIILKNITPFKELDLAKTNFIATVSHELKTPIASIQMCAQLLTDNRVGTLNEEQSKILNTVNEETARLMKITGELLDLAQVETGNIQLHYETINPKQIVEYAYDALKFQADQKEIQIEIQYQDIISNVKADLDKTVWVLVNFLSNAIHYSTEKSKIIIMVREQSGKVIFSVQDFGRGIDPRYKDKIFDKFYKVPGSDSRSGTGLGLAISKDFITSEGGVIWVESELGKGSKFNFDLKISS